MSLNDQDSSALCVASRAASRQPPLHTHLFESKLVDEGHRGPASKVTESVVQSIICALIVYLVALVPCHLQFCTLFT